MIPFLVFLLVFPFSRAWWGGAPAVKPLVLCEEKAPLGIPFPALLSP